MRNLLFIYEKFTRLYFYEKPERAKLIEVETKWRQPRAACAQSCLAFCDPMDYSLTGSSVHGISPERILAWVATSFSRVSSSPRD